MGQCSTPLKNPPSEYNGVIDHLMSLLKSCVSSHSFNKGKMSSVYRPQKMDHLIFRHWLWDMFMNKSLWGYTQSCSPWVSLPLFRSAVYICIKYYIQQSFVISALPLSFLLTSHHYGAMTVNCNCTSLLLCHNYSCDSAQGENDLMVFG